VPAVVEQRAQERVAGTGRDGLLEPPAVAVDGADRDRPRPGARGQRRRRLAAAVAQAQRARRARPSAAPEWSVTSAAPPSSRRAAISSASQARPSASRPANASSRSSSGQPAWSASTSARRWSMPLLSAAAGRANTSSSRPPAAIGMRQSVGARPRRPRIARSHSPPRRAGASATFSGTNAQTPWRRTRPARGAASPASTRSRLVLPLPFGPARWIASPACSSRSTPVSTVRRPRRTDRALASSRTGTGAA
jgi:hypothetical protein